MGEGIVYQNKDIEFKLLSETFKEKSFEAYGLTLPRIKEVLPTNLPEVSANEKRIDNLFLLEDDSVAIVDYESEDKVANRVKYVNYIGRVMERYCRDSKKIPILRMIVIYTGDVNRASDIMDQGCLTLRMDQVFVSHLPVEDIYRQIKYKLEHKKPLTEQELMRLIILPLAEKGTDGKQKRIKQVVDLAKMIKTEREQTFVIAGILVCSDKFIDREYAKSIRRYLSMTKVFQILEEEKREAVLAERKKTAKETAKEIAKETAERMIEAGESVAKIMQYTKLTQEEIEAVRKNMMVFCK